MHPEAVSWIQFLRAYGPVAANDNMYDETIQRAARRTKVVPLTFEHPRWDDVRASFADPTSRSSVILTGTAGDGKTHLCRKVWELLGGDVQAWQSNEPYLAHAFIAPDGRPATFHLIRDLSAWAPQQGLEWTAEKHSLALRFSRALFDEACSDVFLVAANDGQLLESWKRLGADPEAMRARETFETLLVEDRQALNGVRLRLFNLSRTSSAELLSRALQAFLSHERWTSCYGASEVDGFFGPDCPIRRNYELLTTPLVQRRLLALLALCDHNRLHVPIRHILLLLSNAVLGHPDAKDRLMNPGDSGRFQRIGTTSRASLYNNLFGGNLSETRRDSLPVFDYLTRFRIGYETSNRIDNILIFGDADDDLRPYFEQFLASDPFYGAGPAYRAAQREYVEGGDEDEERAAAFLEQLAGQRRALFFKIPEAQEAELRLWELTVFQFAGEYLSQVVGVLRDGRKVSRQILGRIVRGLNRVFTGMLVASDREILLATSMSYSSAPVSRLLEERISVPPRRGEKVEIVSDGRLPVLRVTLDETIGCDLQLHLTRFEFLSRVGDGALPGSFSRECYEDILAFKSHLLGALRRRREADGEEPDGRSFQLLSLDDNGNPKVDAVEINHV
jgi:hypothetical protein